MFLVGRKSQFVGFLLDFGPFWENGPASKPILWLMSCLLVKGLGGQIMAECKCKMCNDFYLYNHHEQLECFSSVCLFLLLNKICQCLNN